MNKIIIGNLIAFIASLMMVYTGLLKRKKDILYIQTIQIILSVISNVILGGIVGALVNFTSAIRNILCYYNKLNIVAKIIISIIVIFLSLYFNNLAFIGLLPLISTISYLYMMNIKNIIFFKLLIIFTMILWGIYDFYIKSYTSSIFDFLTVIVNTYSIIKIKNLKNNRHEWINLL